MPSLPSLSSLPSIIAVKQLATLIHLPYERKYQEGKIQTGTSEIKTSVTSKFLKPDLPSAEDKLDLSEQDTLPAAPEILSEQETKQSTGDKNTTLLALPQAIIIDPLEYTDIEEPNDELITTPVDRTG